MKLIATLFLVLTLTGCGGTPAQWQSALEGANRISAPTAHHRNVSTPEPMKNIPTDWDHVPGSYSTENNGTMRYMINTPQGIQYRTCQNLDGNYQYCH